MNNDEAKFVLKGYRPGGADASSPEFKEALEQARNDPALREWFERQQQFDALVSSRLRDIAPPADLRASILAGARATPAKRTPFLPVFLALAASVAILLAVFKFQRQKQADFSLDALASVAARDMTDGQHGSNGQLTSWVVGQLASTTLRVSSGLPASFDNLKKDGCRTLMINGREALEVCFERAGEEYHLYVCRVDTGASAPPRFDDQKNFTVATWTDRENAYALVGRSRDSITRVL